MKIKMGMGTSTGTGTKKKTRAPTANNKRTIISNKTLRQLWPPHTIEKFVQQNAKRDKKKNNQKTQQSKTKRIKSTAYKQIDTCVNKKKRQFCLGLYYICIGACSRPPLRNPIRFTPAFVAPKIAAN